MTQKVGSLVREPCGQSYKGSTIVNYVYKVIPY